MKTSLLFLLLITLALLLITYTPTVLAQYNVDRETLSPWLLLSLALLDSVNPCDIAIMISLVIAITSIAGKYKAIGAVIAFSLAIYLTYFLIGIGLSQILSFFPRWLGIAIAILFGVYTLYSGILSLRGGVCKVCRDRDISRFSSMPIIGGFTLGLIVSLTLTPCTAGPYIIFTGILAGLTIWKRILYLLLYNLIFISPMLTIGVIAAIAVGYKNISYSISRYTPFIRIVSGITVIAIGIWLAPQILYSNL